MCIRDSSILPHVLVERELVGGNAVVETGTFLAILSGTLLAGVLVAANVSMPTLGVVLLTVAVLGAAASLLIPRTGSAQPGLTIDWNPARATATLVRAARENRTVWQAVLGVSWFWFFGALMLAQFPALAQTVMGGDASVVTMLLAVFSVGVAVGSLLCERLSGHRVDIGLVPFGSIGMTVFAMHLVWVLPTQLPSEVVTAGTLLEYGWGRWAMWDLFWIAVFGGFFIVPLYALIQSRTPKTHQSRIVAANNVLNAVFMVASAGLAAGMLATGFDVLDILLTAAVLNALVAAHIYRLVPEFLWRFVIFILVRTVYRVRAAGVREAVPQEGGALIVANHVSFADALVLQAVIDRPVRFVMDEPIYRLPLANYLFRAANAIPITSPHRNRAVYDAAMQATSTALANGELVAIFPEGRITRDGQMNAFKGGYLRILERFEAPVVAIGLGGLWGSMFSRQEKSWRRRLRANEWGRRLTVAAERIAPAHWERPERLRDIVQVLSRIGQELHQTQVALQARQLECTAADKAHAVSQSGQRRWMLYAIGASKGVFWSALVGLLVHLMAMLGLLVGAGLYLALPGGVVHALGVVVMQAGAGVASTPFWAWLTAGAALGAGHVWRTSRLQSRRVPVDTTIAAPTES